MSASDEGDGRDEALERMLISLCLDPGADIDFRSSPGDFAARFAVDPRDAATLSAGGRRLPLYRKLVRHALAGTIRAVLGAVVPRLEREAPGLFESCLDAFVPGAYAVALRDVPRAFYLASRERIASDDRVAPWLLEAADVLLTEHEVGAAADVEGASAASDLALDRGLVFAPAIALRRYAYSVPEHDLGSESAPGKHSGCWLATRDHDHAVSWRELSPAGGAFLERALAGASLAEAARGAINAVDVADVSRLVAELAGEKLLLGGREAADGAGDSEP